jgi:hypothetical protein
MSILWGLRGHRIGSPYPPILEMFQSVVQPPCAKASSRQAASVRASANYAHARVEVFRSIELAEKLGLRGRHCETM